MYMYNLRIYKSTYVHAYVRTVVHAYTVDIVHVCMYYFHA